MRDIIRGLRSVQQQIDVLVEQLNAMVPDNEDRLAEVCTSLGQKPICVAEPISVKPYESVAPGFWVGFAKTEQVGFCQHLRADSGREETSYIWTISTGPDFRSEWLTLEFPVSRAAIVTKRSLSINLEVSSNISGSLQFALKSHGKNIEPKFSELAKYDLEQGMLQIADIAPLARSMAGLSDQYDDLRILAVLPSEANAKFAFSRFLLSML